MTLADVRAGGRFVSRPEGRTNFGFTRDAIWIRFKLQNHTSAERELLLMAASPLTESVSIFGVSDNRPIFQESGGSSRPFGKRDVLHPTITFRLFQPPGTATEYYVRIASDLRMDIPLRLFAPAHFYRYVYIEQMLQGVYIGIVLVAIGYNLFLAISLRSRSYLLYVGMVTAIGLTMTAQGGYTFQYLWPDNVVWNKRSVSTLAALSTGLACLFAIALLDLQKRFVGWTRTIATLAVVMFCISLAAASGLPLLLVARIGNVAAFVSIVVLLAAGVVLLLQGYRPARYYLVAIGGFSLAVLAFLLAARGLIPGGEWATYSLQVGSAFEIIFLSLSLGDRINMMQARTRSLEQEGLRREVELRRIESELALARRIQMSNLPNNVPQVRGLRIAAYYEPMQAIGGDFYDFYTSADDELAVLVADVSGHGIPAALIASMLKVACARETSLLPKPDRFLMAVNRSILGNQSDQFITASLGVINSGTGELQYVNAGHPPLFLVSDGAVSALRPHGRLIGVFESPHFEVHRVRVRPGDRLVFLTDGVLEAHGPQRELFGKDRLEQHLLDHRHLDCAGYCSAIVATLAHWNQGALPEDDVTLVIVDVE